MDLYNRQSSAKSRTEEAGSTTEGMSLIWHKKRRGPSTVPCGTPDRTLSSRE